jgi:hypothetical protein
MPFPNAVRAVQAGQTFPSVRRQPARRCGERLGRGGWGDGVERVSTSQALARGYLSICILEIQSKMRQRPSSRQSRPRSRGRSKPAETRAWTSEAHDSLRASAESQPHPKPAAAQRIQGQCPDCARGCYASQVLVDPSSIDGLPGSR